MFERLFRVRLKKRRREVANPLDILKSHGIDPITGKTFGAAGTDADEDNEKPPELPLPKRGDKTSPIFIGWQRDHLRGTRHVYINHEDRFRHIVVFGGTGYGKCLKRDEVVLVYVEGNGWRFSEIGSLVEEVFERHKEEVVQYDHETEVVFGDAVPERYYVYALDPDELRVVVTPIKAFVRVKAPDKLYRVTLESGKEVVVTGAHNFFAIKDGEFGVFRTVDLEAGCLVPVIRGNGNLWLDPSLDDDNGKLVMRTYISVDDDAGGEVEVGDVVVVGKNRFETSVFSQLMAINGIDYDVVETEEKTYLRVARDSLDTMAKLVDAYSGRYEPEEPQVELKVEWEEIKDIEVIENSSEEYVYDLSTECETFLAGLGGIFVHNTTLLVNMMLQDMEAGRGFCFIDPKGDAIEDLLMRAPEHRVNDIIVIDPANYEKVVGLNLLEVDGKGLAEHQINAIKERLVSDIVVLMKQNTKVWGERFGRIFQALIRAMLDYNETAPPEEQLTFLDLYVLLLNKDKEEMRTRFIEAVRDPVLRMYLEEISQMKKEDLEPLVRRLGDWVQNKVARQVIAHRSSTIDFREIIDSNKIVLVRVPKGEVGDDIMQLLGLAVISKIWASAKSRVDTPPEKREPFFLYVDEFKNFAFEESTLDEILSEARAFKLGVVLAAQYPSQLSQKIKEAVYGNCGTVIAFNPQNSNDASIIVKRFPNVRVEDLLSLGKYTIMVRLMQNNEMTDPDVVYTYPPPKPLRSRDEIVELVEVSLNNYGKERVDKTDLSESFRKLMELSLVSVKDSSVNDALSVMYTLMAKYGEDVKITYDLFASEAKRRNFNITSVQFAEIVDVLERMNVVKRHMDPVTGTVYLVLNPDEVRNKYWMDKLTGQNAGKLEHRHLIRNVYEFFAKKGYIVHVNPHAGSATPDIILRLPPPPIDGSLEEIERHIAELKKEGLWQLTNGKDAIVEIEHSGLTKPGEILKKLSRAYRNNKMVIYVVQGKGSSYEEYTSEARHLHRILEDMRGKKGLFKTNEIERDSQGRKLWVHKSSGAIAYEERGALYDTKTHEIQCLVSEARDKNWVPKRVEFDPTKEFPHGLPKPLKDYRIVIFPPDGTDIPVLELLPPGAPAKNYKLVPLERDILHEDIELSKALNEYLKRLSSGKEVSFWEVLSQINESSVGLLLDDDEISEIIHSRLEEIEKKTRKGKER